MKRFCLVLFYSLLFQSLIFAQDTYHVIFVKGTILEKSTQKPIQRGDKLDAGTEIIFKRPDAFATILSKTKGRFNLKANPDKPQNEFITYVKNCISPPNPRLSSEFGKSIDLSQFKQKDASHNLIVFKQISLEIDGKKYPTGEKANFILTKMGGGSSPKRQSAFVYQLKTEGNQVLIGRKDIKWAAKKGRKGTGFSLGYMKMTDVTLNIETFSGIKIDAPRGKALKNSVKEILIVLNSINADREEKLEEITGFLIDHFGEPDPEDLKTWLLKKFPKEI